MSILDYWRKLEEEFLSFLSQKGYTPDGLQHYSWTMKLLVRYVNANRYEVYTPQIGMDFLESEERLMYLKPASYKFQRTTIRRLNEYLDGEKYSPSYLRVNYECPEPFREDYDRFIESLLNSGLKYNTIKQYRVFIAKLFQDFVNYGVSTWDAVNAQVLSGAFARSTNKMTFATYTKKLFKYLVGEKIVKYNYSGILPKVPYFKRIPSVYSTAEIDKILNSVNRSTALGKRDYAILMLAARLGMCAADIRLLRFENINFEKKLIEFARYKTGVRQRLTLLPEVDDALRDYIDNARGDSQEPYVFMTNRKSVQVPATAGVISNAAAKYFRESGVEIGDRHHSSHALRMSLASALVAENVPYDAVRTILGHEDPDAITHYVKLDVENIRFCALDVPAPRGRLAEYLACEKGVTVNA